MHPSKAPDAVAPVDVHAAFTSISTRDLSRGKVASLVPGIPLALFSGLFAVVAVRPSTLPAAVALDIVAPGDVPMQDIEHGAPH